MVPAAPARRALPRVRIGVMPLTDCAPLVMASVLGFDRRHGVEIVLSRESSWARLRDKLAAGELDLAHALYGLVYGLQLGIGGPRRDMAVLMALSRNGQGITLSNGLAAAGARDLAGLVRLIEHERRRPTLAQTFPTGTHALWLYYWLAAGGVHPMRDTRIVTVPPPQMVAHMQQGLLDGFSVGEPWNQCAIQGGVGFTAATSQAIWPDHPEKVLGGSADWVEREPDAARAVIQAVLEAGRWIDAKLAHRERVAEVLAAPAWLGVPADTIAPRLNGDYHDGVGGHWRDAHAMRFFDDGAVNFPYLSDGIWFMTQYRRWGLLDAHPDYLGVARRVQRTGLYAEAAGALGVALPSSPMRRSRLIDGVVWDGHDPAAYADAFRIRALAPQPAAA